jgi:hypothetical protein
MLFLRGDASITNAAGRFIRPFHFSPKSLTHSKSEASNQMGGFIPYFKLIGGVRRVAIKPKNFQKSMSGALIWRTTLLFQQNNNY